jgi:hypothetical protein
MRFNGNFLHRFFTAVLFAVLGFNAVKARAEDDITALLAGRVEHDRELKLRAIELRQAELIQSQTELSNGFSVKLNTGSLLFTFAGDAAFQAEPSISIALPAANDAALSVSAPLSAGGGEGLTMSNTAFTLSVDVTGSARKKRTVELLQAERTVTEAKRTLQKRALETERDFYEALRRLYEEEAALYAKNETRWTEELEFDKIRAQGYDENSAAFRAARMELTKAEHEALEAERLLQRNIAVFARDCGVEALAALPRAVPAPSGELLSLAGFDRSRYAELESAEWRRYINALSREADGELGVRVEGGATVNNTAFQSGAGGGANSINAGVSLSWRGLTFSGGLEFPAGQGGSPALRLSLGVDSESFALTPLKKQQNALAAQKELIEIENSVRDWDDLLAEADRTRSDLLWQRSERSGQLELYRELLADMRGWFERGVIAESEYRKAEANMENALYNCLITDTEIILYQIEMLLYVIAE